MSLGRRLLTGTGEFYTLEAPIDSQVLCTTDRLGSRQMGQRVVSDRNLTRAILFTHRTLSDREVKVCLPP